MIISYCLMENLSLSKQVVAGHFESWTF